MAVTIANIVENDQITGDTDLTVDTLYTATGVTTQVNAFTAANSSASPVVLSVYILASGTTAATVLPIAVESIPATGSAIVGGILGHVVPTGGTIKAFAGTTNVVYVSASGIEVS